MRVRAGVHFSWGKKLHNPLCYCERPQGAQQSPAMVGGDCFGRSTPSP